jgi:methylmalonyl-CoA mutase N-terminal domain/subunit
LELHESSNIEEWRATTARQAREKSADRQAEFSTSSHIVVPDLATAEDLQDVDLHAKLSYPGEFPFTRGIHPSMYRSRLWTMRQYAGFASAEESNKRYHFLLSQGTTGLSVAFDLPTQMGYDADHPIAEGEVGKVGVSISSLEEGAAGTANLLPLIITAVEAYATLGEISDAMRHAFGEQHEFSTSNSQ